MDFAYVPTVHGLAEAVSYALTHGIIIYQSKGSSGVNVTHAPFTFSPSPVNAHCYKKAAEITPAVNRMVHAIAQNREYLEQTLSETAVADPDFTGRLFSIMQTTTPTDIQLALCRYDYFITRGEDSHELRMVEMNCISASFAGLSSKTTALHRHLSTHPSCRFSIDQAQLPENDPLVRLSAGIATAHQMFVDRYKPSLPTVILMVIQPDERNVFDQYMIESALWSTHNITVVRSSLSNLCANGWVDDNGMFILKPDGVVADQVTVSVVYFRAGYTPDDYPSEKEWSAREALEKSKAVKCPSVAMQLVGTKKIQQVLDKEGQVEQFLPNKAEADAVRSTFAGQYSLSTEDDVEHIVRMALERPGDFVLKPQREGGGNNLYGNELKKALETMSPSQRAAYVLMERILPVTVENVIVRNGKYERATVVSELGVFGVHVVEGDRVLNYAAGALLRSKASSHEDGGVAAGVAVLDSPLLVD